MDGAARGAGGRNKPSRLKAGDPARGGALA
jgi:hypothetical protein